MLNKRCMFPQGGTIYTINKMWIVSMEKCYCQLQAKDGNFTKSKTPPWVISLFFLNCTNDTKQRKTSQIYLENEKDLRERS